MDPNNYYTDQEGVRNSKNPKFNNTMDSPKFEDSPRDMDKS